MTSRRLVVAGCVAGVVALGATGALASWTGHGTGSAAARSSHLSTPGTPTQAAVTSSSASIAWSAATAGTATVRYHVERADFGSSTWADACGSTTAAPILGASCTDTGLAATHDYVFRVTAQVGGWRRTSGTSAKITTLTPPSVVVTQPTAGQNFANNGAMTKNCDTIVKNATGVCGTKTAGSNAVSSVTMTLQRTFGTTTQYWNGSSWVASSSVLTTTLPNSNSWIYNTDYATLRLGATGTITYTATVTVTDIASQTGTASRTFTTS